MLKSVWTKAMWLGSWLWILLRTSFHGKDLSAKEGSLFLLSFMSMVKLCASALSQNVSRSLADLVVFKRWVKDTSCHLSECAVLGCVFLFLFYNGLIVCYWLKARTGIAYISNVAVRENFRRKGIAKRLIWKAEALAKNWGCRAIGLHCDLNNLGATKLYKDQGFRCIKIPEGANWPQPKISPDTRFNFMMKLVNNTQALEKFR